MNRISISSRLEGLAIIIAMVLPWATPSLLQAQGCIASRGAGGGTSCHLGEAGGSSVPESWEASVGYRWLHSDRMFSGDVEQTQRAAEGSQEINDSHFIDLSLRYSITPRWSLDLTIPTAVNDRSQVVRALNRQRTIIGRFHTHSTGLGDIRLMGYGWVLEPANHPRGNVQIGLGISAPSGDRNIQDTFLIPGRRGPVAQTHAVDQSIQLGVGGWGCVLEVAAYQQLIPRLSAYINGAYMLTPEESYTPTASLNGDYSISDNYLARGGFEWVAWPSRAIAFSLGARIEGVPVHDLVGGSEGFRRPGYAISIEPGISTMYHSWTASLTAPVAVYRNRQQSVPEQESGLEPVAAGFADFVFIFRLSRTF